MVALPAEVGVAVVKGAEAAQAGVELGFLRLRELPAQAPPVKG